MITGCHYPEGVGKIEVNSRATCGRVYLWVADPRQVTFLCLSKEKSPRV